MKKSFYFVFISIILLSLVACGSNTQDENKGAGSVESPSEEVVEITDENLKQSKQDLLQKMANDLYLEAEKEIDAAPAVKMDETGIYDDIKSVDVIVDLPPALLTLDLGTVEEENGNYLKEKAKEE